MRAVKAVFAGLMVNKGRDKSVELSLSADGAFRFTPRSSKAPTSCSHTGLSFGDAGKLSGDPRRCPRGDVRSPSQVFLHCGVQSEEVSHGIHWHAGSQFTLTCWLQAHSSGHKPAHTVSPSARNSSFLTFALRAVWWWGAGRMSSACPSPARPLLAHTPRALTGRAAGQAPPHSSA